VENFSKGQYSLSLNEFTKLISARGVRLDRIELVKGWYDQVLQGDTKEQLPIKRAAFIFIDCDLYGSTVPVLNFITDYLQPLRHSTFINLAGVGIRF
jgi:O-methyltransferase